MDLQQLYRNLGRKLNWSLHVAAYILSCEP